MNIVNENFDPRKISEFSEKDLEVVIRPKEFEDFSGQDKILENLKVFVKAAKMRRIFGSCSVSWSSRFGKDNIGQYHSK